MKKVELIGTLMTVVALAMCSRGPRQRRLHKGEIVMKNRISVAVVAVVVLLAASAASAQMQHPGPPSPGQAPSGSQQPMMGMMCPMMGMMHGGGMEGMGMMGTMPNMSDPKAAARMLKLHGDMMKAMGEVMLKHAQALEQEK
jgi:hypothetical protein